MLPDRDVTRLWHMLEAAKHVLDFAVGHEAADLSRDLQFAFAVQHGLEIIGEAAAQVSGATREQFPRVEWPKIVGLRNRIVHVYFEVDPDVVWETIARDLPVLIGLLEEALRDYPSPPSTWPSATPQ